MTIYFKNLDLSKIYKERAARRSKRNPVNSFPLKLYRMLETVTREGKDHIVGWGQDGVSFHVHDTDLFLTEILPSYFRQTKYKSFQRQLNFYGFRRINHGPLEGSYCHEWFVRGNEEQCKKIRRQTNQEAQQRARNNDMASVSSSGSTPSCGGQEEEDTQPPDLLECSERSEPETLDSNTTQQEDAEDDFLSTLMQNIMPAPPQLESQESIILEGTPISMLGGKFYYVAPASSGDLLSEL